MDERKESIEQALRYLQEIYDEMRDALVQTPAYNPLSNDCVMDEWDEKFSDIRQLIEELL